MNRVLLIGALLFCASARADTPLAPGTIVLFNKNVPESVELAKFYAQKRSIPRDHLVSLDCSTAEEISREEYEATIRDPLREALEQHGWWKVDRNGDVQRVSASSIHFVAVLKGLPLKIRGTTRPDPADHAGTGPIGNRNEAAVDSEISVLGAFSPQISGVLQNPYFQSYRTITEIDAPQLLLVSRLDAPSAATVRQMINDAIEAERTGLWGRAYIDGAHNLAGGLHLGDEWLAQISEQLRKAGVPAIYEDTPALFPDGFPMSNCALYYGWYADTANGPFAQPWFRFTKGAIAVHIHSFSASTLRDENAHWVAPLLTKGAAATLGNVYEPYLQFTAHLDIFNDRLLHGFTLAESATMAMPALSWMNVTLGDPLYRPYAAWLQLEAKRDAEKAKDDWHAYHDFATQNAGRSAAEFRSAARQFASRNRNGPMLEDIALLEMHDNNLAAAAAAFAQARAIYSTRDDILRVILEESDVWLRDKKPKRALELVRSVERVISDAPAAPLLKHIEQEALGALSNAPKR